MKIVSPSIAVVRNNMTLYLSLNLVLYGLFVAMMIVTAMFPQLQAAAIERAHSQLDSLSGPFAGIVPAYQSGNMALAALLTFFANLIIGALGTTTLPSLLIPFAGMGLNLYRFFEFGLLFAPVNAGEVIKVLPHLLTLIIEGQAYVIGTLGAVLLWLKTIRPGTYGISDRYEGYKSGLQDIIRLYPLVIAILLIGAVYEAFEIIYIVPHL